MQISITNTVFQTQIFILIFTLVLIFSLQKKFNLKIDNALTEELKGFAMLAIVLSHIGYFLVSDHAFLFPLSVEAGVGVNLFLLLSGFGLTLSQLQKPLSIKQFYLKRLPKLFIPLWIVITALFLIDGFWLHKTYHFSEIIKSYLGFFPSSDIFDDLNSPLWYLTMILFFYIIFPLLFWSKKLWLSIIAIFGFAYLLLSLPLPLDHGVQDLYKLHFLAFPLGMLTAWILAKRDKFNTASILSNFFIRVLLAFSAFAAFAYFAINSGVGHGKDLEQTISIVSTYLIMLVFWLKQFRFRLFNLVGKYSYEIYLLHWPIIFRYQNLFKLLPAWLTVIFYLVELILLGILLQKVVSFISRMLRSKE